ncbi:Hypothetical predicted protein, partial [Paramuricea clavata]
LESVISGLTLDFVNAETCTFYGYYFDNYCYIGPWEKFRRSPSFYESFDTEREANTSIFSDDEEDFLEDTSSDESLRHDELTHSAIEALNAEEKHEEYE